MSRASLVALFLLTGCATLVNGTNTELDIRSEPAGASFALRDGAGRVVASGQTPTTVKVSRGSGFFQPARYELQVAKPGYLPKNTVISTRIDSLWWIDSLLFVPGLFVDPFTGAMWHLQNPPVQQLTIDVPFTRPP